MDGWMSDWLTDLFVNTTTYIVIDPKGGRQTLLSMSAPNLNCKGGKLCGS